MGRRAKSEVNTPKYRLQKRTFACPSSPHNSNLIKIFMIIFNNRENTSFQRTFSPGLISKLTSFSTNGKPLRDAISTLLKVIPPFIGHVGSGSFSVAKSPVLHNARLAPHILLILGKLRDYISYKQERHIWVCPVFPHTLPFVQFWRCSGQYNLLLF